MRKKMELRTSLFENPIWFALCCLLDRLVRRREEGWLLHLMSIDLAGCREGPSSAPRIRMRSS
jgi:hypothetical protein